MPLDKHPLFEEPCSEDRLWRYMDVPKFLSMLTTKQLWLSSAETLSAVDPFEGRFTGNETGHRNWKTIDDVPEPKRSQILGSKHAYIPASDIRGRVEWEKKVLEDQLQFSILYRRAIFLSCWHLSRFESYAMWNIYAKWIDGVAITTSIDRMRSSLEETQESLFMGKVRYIDYTADQVSRGNALSPYLHKRENFSYENESRLVYWDTSMTHREGPAEQISKEFGVALPPFIDPRSKMSRGLDVEEMRQLAAPPGVAIKCDLAKLVEAVWVSPAAPLWFFDAISEVTRTLGLTVPVQKSSLLVGPDR